MFSGKRKGNSQGYALVLWCLMILAALGAACGGGKSENAAAVNAEKQNSNLVQQKPVSEIDRGDFKLSFQTPKKVRNNAPSPDAMVDKAVLEPIIASINGRVALPVDVNVSFENCEGANALYDTESHRVIICFKLVDEYRELFGRRIKDPEKLKKAVQGATVATLFHELGHALINLWQLPVTGKEEDAADQLSTLALMNRSETGEEMALNGAVSFALYADLTQEYEKIYWDEHSLDEQRFYDTICLIYGQHPDKYDYLIKDGTLPEERAALCPDEFARVNQAWQTLLKPYLK
jgi:hypothetical protein